MSRANGFVERMQAGKDRAASLRARGLTAGSVWKPAKQAPLDSSLAADFSRAFWIARECFRLNDCGAAVENYLRAVYPERYDAEDIPW